MYEKEAPFELVGYMNSAGPPHSDVAIALFISGHTLVVDGANWQRRLLTTPADAGRWRPASYCRSRHDLQRGACHRRLPSGAPTAPRPSL